MLLYLVINDSTSRVWGECTNRNKKNLNSIRESLNRFQCEIRLDDDEDLLGCFMGICLAAYEKESKQKCS